jgi:hypothetical protein
MNTATFPDSPQFVFVRGELAGIVDRPPIASLVSLVTGLRCSWCPGSAPMPIIVGLHALPPAASAYESA